jgi:hypothetical protein
VKFLTPEDAAELEELQPEVDTDADMGPHERSHAWQVPGVRAGLGWVSGAVVVSTLALLGLNSHALANWADQLPVASVTAPVVNAADGWHDAAGPLGLNAVVDAVEGRPRPCARRHGPARRSQAGILKPRTRIVVDRVFGRHRVFHPA